jgi:hypothetical protein
VGAIPEHPTCVRGIVLRQDEGRFAESEFASSLLHALGRNAGGVSDEKLVVTLVLMPMVFSVRYAPSARLYLLGVLNTYNKFILK